MMQLSEAIVIVCALESVVIRLHTLQRGWVVRSLCKPVRAFVIVALSHCNSPAEKTTQRDTARTTEAPSIYRISNLFTMWDFSKLKFEAARGFLSMSVPPTSEFASQEELRQRKSSDAPAIAVWWDVHQVTILCQRSRSIGWLLRVGWGDFRVKSAVIRNDLPLAAKGSCKG
jgi:hypothetical protein